MESIHALKSGQSVGLVASSGQFAEEGPKHEVRVRYDSEPSYGDNGKKVPGATVGRYTITYPGGRTSVHEHGPNANTEGARRRGANPNAKTLTAHRVSSEVVSHLHARQMGFNDRRR